MTRQEIEGAVIRALISIQADESGRELVPIGPDTRPIAELPGFDTLNGVEATLLLERALGRELGTDQLFVSADGRRALPVSEVVERLFSEILVGDERL